MVIKDTYMKVRRRQRRQLLKNRRELELKEQRELCDLYRATHRFEEGWSRIED